MQCTWLNPWHQTLSLSPTGNSLWTQSQVQPQRTTRYAPNRITVAMIIYKASTRVCALWVWGPGLHPWKLLTLQHCWVQPWSYSTAKALDTSSFLISAPEGWAPRKSNGELTLLSRGATIGAQIVTKYAEIKLETWWWAWNQGYWLYLHTPSVRQFQGLRDKPLCKNFGPWKRMTLPANHTL